MRTNVIALMAVCLSVTAATAQTDEDIKGALGEVGGELQVCSVYFGVISNCIKPQRPDLAITYSRASDKIMEMANSAQRAAGVSDEAMIAQVSLYTEAMVKALGGHCTNIAVLLNRYMNFCQQLSQDADPRLKKWIACIHARQQSCGGPGLP